jgi:hypothetical protein
MKKIIAGFVFFFLLSFWSFGTVKPPGGGGPPACWPPPCSVPIDGGISFLLAAGAAFGTKKILDQRKK